MPVTNTAVPLAFTILDEGRAHAGPATLEGDTLWVAPEALRAATGWELKPQGVCREEVCIPREAHRDLVVQGQVNLTALAALLQRPLAVDAAERTAYLGASAQQRSDRLRSLEAPDFTLQDSQGRPHSLHEHRGRKVLLVAYASW